MGTNITKRMNSKIGYILVVMGLAACANDDFVDVDPTSNNGGAIGFGSGIEAVTRAASGKDAADKLGSTFYVFGIKNESTKNPGQIDAQDLVFENYKVTYVDGTAGTATSNTSGWDYAGLQLSDKEKNNIKENVADKGYQTVKYWDANAKDYTYYAFSAKSDDIEKDRVKVTKTTDNTGTVYDNGYSVELTDQADPTSLYFSNRLNIKQSAITSTANENTYGGEVQFTFRNAMAKVRVGMYETIPGYSVTIDGFEVVTDNTNPTFAQMGTQVTTGFAANLASNKKGEAGTMKVTYKSSDDVNRPVVAFGEVDNNDFKEKKDAVLYLGDNLKAATALNTSTTQLVYDDANGAYTDVYPMEGNEHNLKLKVDFTLHSTVDETITVKGATAEVPAQYLQWKPGCAYTYIFKISDQTNGVLGSLTGLHPITFEAVNIIDGTGEDELISTTTAANYNIITFGCDADHHKVTVGQDDYNAGDDIYAVVVYGESSTTGSTTTTKVSDVTWDDTGKPTKLYEVTTTNEGSYPITEASVENYLNNYASNANLLDAPVTAIPVADDAEDKAEYVDKVPKGDETSGTNSLNAMKWKAKKTVYAVEYTVPNTSTKTKYYKVVRVDGFTGKIDGELTLSQTVFENGGGTTTATLKINNEAITSGVTYALDTAGKYGTAVPSTITIENDNTIKVESNTAADTYTLIATYNRRTYTAQFTVKQWS